ncbi:MAG: hypothetical protein IJO50_03225 [Clostridia bacterium]|nr:hypothetical protein [Clostridia bacterium]
MKQFSAKLNIILFLLLLCIFFFIGVLAPKDLSTIEKENRELKAMPALTKDRVLSGSFSKDFEDYLADNVGYRSFFVDLASKIENTKGIKTKDGRIVTTTKDLGTGNAGDNHLLLLSDRVMEVYQKNDTARDAYAAALNRYAETLPEDVRLISMLIPTQIEFYQGKNNSDSQKETIDYIYQSLDESIVTVPAYEALQAHKDEYIFFRTDHHWTQRGAFYGYSAFTETLFGQRPLESDYEIRSADGFLGYLYSQANDPSLKKYADTIEWFTKGENLTVKAKALENGANVCYESKLYVEPTFGTAPKYGIFMGGDHQFAEITTENKNGKTLLVMKDSYANTLLPFLVEQYETVLVIDPRNYFGTVTALTEEYDIDDFLIVNYVFTTTFNDFIDKMNAVR